MTTFMSNTYFAPTSMSNRVTAVHAGIFCSCLGQDMFDCWNAKSLDFTWRPDQVEKYFIYCSLSVWFWCCSLVLNVSNTMEPTLVKPNVIFHHFLFSFCDASHFQTFVSLWVFLAVHDPSHFLHCLHCLFMPLRSLEVWLACIYDMKRLSNSICVSTSVACHSRQCKSIPFFSD